MNQIDVAVIPGPTVFNADSTKTAKYISVGIKYYPLIENILEDMNPDLAETMALRIKSEILKLKEHKNELNPDGTFNADIMTLTDEFFEYLKNNDTKIQAIRVSLDDYTQDHKEQRLRTLKTHQMVITADEQSMDDVFDSVVKELYYHFGDSVIDLYSIILTPKLYKIVNNMPVEYRSVLIRVKK